MRLPGATFFCLVRHSPILRIGIAAACISLITACSKNGSDSNPNAPSPSPAPGSTIVYTALGASDANGVGSSVVCVPFTDCSNGMGYVPVAVRALRSQGFTVSHLNLGVPTATISRDFQTLGNQYNHLVAGNFIEQEMPFVQTSATVVTTFAGLNEVNVLTAALGAGAGGTDVNGFIDRQVQLFGTGYGALLSGIRARAGAPRIIALNVPNAAGLPYLTRATSAQRLAAQRISVGMTTTVVNPLTAQGIVVIDLMCDARSYTASNYSSDGLHPNDAGYAFIAGEVVRAITTASYPAPQTNCSSMTIAR